MISFDVLNDKQTIEGCFLIEASAGTGKTFTIEHVVLKLVQEKKIPLHRILLLTFTQASQQDLIERVFSRLKKGGTFGFLEEMPILTFQKFVSRFLKKNDENLKETKIYTEIEYFIKTLIPYHEFGPKQLFKSIFSVNTDSDKVIKNLYDAPKYEGELFKFFEIKKNLLSLIEQLSLEKLELLSEGFKQIQKSDLDLFALFYEDFDAALDEQLSKKDLGFFKLVPSNQKARKKVDIPSEVGSIIDLLTIGSDPKMLSALLKELYEKNKDSKIQSFSADFDLFLEQLDDEKYLNQISEKFSAVIVDEFQDTDPRQWEVLSKLFFRKPHIHTFMIVGDPKQSIYRFRNADYTSFFKAKNNLLENEIYQLATSWRFSLRLTEALNALFLKVPNPFFPIEYHPQIAGRKELGADKPIQIVVFEEHPSSKEEVQKLLFPWLLGILKDLQFDLNKTAILVNDRYEATAIEQYFKQRGMPIKRVDKTPLKDRLCFHQFDLLLKIFKDPFDTMVLRTYHFVKTGKMFSAEEPVDEGYVETVLRVKIIQTKALEGDFIPFLKEFSTTPLFSLLMGKNLSSIEDLYNLYDEIYYNNDPFEDVDDKKEGVELITTFSSKGLEYENVIALSLALDAKRKQMSDEDIQENARLLYVACTRPKERLILPVLAKKESTICRFLKKIVSQIQLHTLLEVFDSPLIEVVAPKVYPDYLFMPILQKECAIPQPSLPPLYYPEKVESASFSSMEFESCEIEKAQAEEGELPLGIQSGLFIHKILEKIFQDQSKELNEDVVEVIIDKHLLFSEFKTYKDYIRQKVLFVLNTKIGSRLLKDIPPFYRIAESMFSFVKEGQKIQGVFDLLIFVDDEVHIVDYKLTHPRSLTTQELMKAFHYDAQGSIYKEAIMTLYPEIKDRVHMHFLFLRNEVHYVL